VCVVMVIGGLINLGIKAYQGKINSWGDGFAAFGIGAAAGAVGFVTGGAAFAAAGGGALGAGGFIAGIAGGAVGSVFAMPIQNLGNMAYFNDPMMTMKEYATGILIGGAFGGAFNGIVAVRNGNGFWNGIPKGSPMPPMPAVQGITKPSPMSNADDLLANQTKIQGVEIRKGYLPPTKPDNVTIGRGDFVGKRITNYYPKNNGFSRQPQEIMLKAGQIIDRYGSEGGKFLSPQGTPASMRSLPPGASNGTLSGYQVVKPFPVQSGTAAAWFGQVGGGIQYLTPISVKELVRLGYLIRVY